MNKKILISLSVIGAVAAIAIGGTIAYFSDTETSTGNTFTAGELDLEIDNTCHYNGMICVDEYWREEEAGSGTGYPEAGTPCTCTWGFGEFQGQAFFNFDDVKPGDFGESTLSFHLVSNPAWACLYIENVVDDDNGCNEPELVAEPECGTDGTGELDEHLSLTVWIDDYEVGGQIQKCDNVYQEGEEELIISNQLLSEYGVVGGYVLPIASSQGLMTDPLPAGDYCIGIAWEIPAETGNEIQTDNLGADLMFYVEQSRNNPNFVCQPLGD